VPRPGRQVATGPDRKAACNTDAPLQRAAASPAGANEARGAPVRPGTPVPAGVLVVGECLVDLAPAPQPATSSGEGGHGKGGQRPGEEGQQFVAMPGGGPANVAVGLARLGVPAAFAGRFSRAGFGPWLRSHLAGNGIDLSRSVDAVEPATLAVVSLDTSGRASYTFYGPETADWQWTDEELSGACDACGAEPRFAAVHTGSLAAAFEPGASALAHQLARLHRAGKLLISFDPNVRKGLVQDFAAYRERLELMISLSHVVKASDEDIGTIYPRTGILEAASRWLAAGTSLVVVTEGAHGATALHRNGCVAHCDPPLVKVVDTIGAGDAFSSGLLAYLHAAQLLSPERVAGITQPQLEMALRQAVTVSAFTCTRPGADPPDGPELEVFARSLAAPPTSGPSLSK